MSIALSLSLIATLSVEFNVEIKIDKQYPYCAWYSQESSIKKEYQGYWFALPVPTGKDGVVFIPDQLTNPDVVYGFFHELGHVADYRNHVVFNSEFDDELSAWKNALNIMKKHHINYDLTQFIATTTEGLSTYLAPEQTLPDLTKILKQSM